MACQAPTALRAILRQSQFAIHRQQRCLSISVSTRRRRVPQTEALRRCPIGHAATLPLAVTLKARRLASEGFRTLLTCYNRPLADHLADLCAGVPNLEVTTFHQLCHRQADRAHRESGRDLLAEAKATYPGRDLFDVQLPNALAYSLEVLPERFDAIVCDEGQDFREEFWLPLELLLSDYERGPLYVFYDDNQNIYRAATFPIRDPPFTLTTNCRNTAPIHRAAYSHYRGVPVNPPDIDGDDVQFDEASSREGQLTKVSARIVDFVARQGVAGGDIVVLIADAPHKVDYYAMLKRQPLPRPAAWIEEGPRRVMWCWRTATWLHWCSPQRLWGPCTRSSRLARVLQP